MKNWQTTVSGIGSAVFALLGALAALPYQLGDVATIIPSKYKEYIFVTAAFSSLVLKVWNSVAQSDKSAK